MERCQEVQNS